MYNLPSIVWADNKTVVVKASSAVAAAAELLVGMENSEG